MDGLVQGKECLQRCTENNEENIQMLVLANNFDLHQRSEQDCRGRITRPQSAQHPTVIKNKIPDNPALKIFYAWHFSFSWPDVHDVGDRNHTPKQEWFSPASLEFISGRKFRDWD